MSASLANLSPVQSDDVIVEQMHKLNRGPSPEIRRGAVIKANERKPMVVFFNPASQIEMDREEIIDDLVERRESDLQYEAEEQVEEYRSDLEEMSDAELAAEFGQRYGEKLELKENDADE